MSNLMSILHSNHIVYTFIGERVKLDILVNIYLISFDITAYIKAFLKWISGDLTICQKPP